MLESLFNKVAGVSKISFFFYLMNFFPFKFFLQQHENTIKNSNKKNNYINQLLRLPLLKIQRERKK